MNDQTPPRAGQVLCRLGDLDGGALGVEIDEPPWRIVIVKQGETVRGYVNSCPHRGTPLEMFPHQFLDETGEELVCATHGARFRIGDGICVFGPCMGEALKPFPVYVEDGRVIAR